MKKNYGHAILRCVKSFFLVVVLLGGGECRAASTGKPLSFVKVLVDRSAPGNLSGPKAADVEGSDIYIADTVHGSIKKVDSTGGVSTIISGLNVPEGITVTSTNIFVSNTGNRSVLKFDKVGGAIGAPITGTLAVPIGAPRGLDVFGNTLYIVDGGTGANSGRLISYDLLTSTLTALGPVLDSPFDVAVNAEGKIFVTEGGASRVRIFEPSGTLSTVTLGGPGTGPGQFLNTGGIAIRGDYIFVVDIGNKRVNVYKKDPSGTINPVDPDVEGLPSSFAHDWDAGTKRPCGIAVDKTTGLIYVTEDFGQSRVQVFYGASAVSVLPTRLTSGHKRIGSLINMSTLHVRGISGIEATATDPGDLENHGEVELTDAKFSVAGDFHQASDASLAVTRSQMAVEGEAVVDGAVVFSPGGTLTQGQVTPILTAQGGITGNPTVTVSHSSLGRFLTISPSIVSSAGGGDSLCATVSAVKDPTTGNSSLPLGDEYANTVTSMQSGQINRWLESSAEQKSFNTFMPISFLPSYPYQQEFHSAQVDSPARGWSDLYAAVERSGGLELEAPGGSTSLWVRSALVQGKSEETETSVPFRDDCLTLIGGVEWQNEAPMQLYGITFGGGFGDTKSRVSKDDSSQHKIISTGVYHSIRPPCLGGNVQWDVFLNANYIMSDHRRVGDNSAGSFIAKGESHTTVLTGATEFSYNAKFPDAQGMFIARPYFGFDYSHSHRAHYTEKDNPDPLSRLGLTMNAWDYYVGMMIRKTWMEFETYAFRAQLDFWYSRDLSRSSGIDTVYAVNDATFIKIPFSGFGKDTYSPSLTLSWMDKATQTKLYLTYATKFQRKRISHAFLVKLSILV